MPRVFIPPQMRDLTGGVEQVEVEGKNVREVVRNLDAVHPGLADRLVAGDRLTPGLAVSIDDQLSTLGLLARVRPDSEVHFLPAIGGG